MSRVRGENEAIVEVMEKRGYDAMLEYAAALQEGREPPPELASAVTPCFVYLAFFGEGGAAQYLKIGVAENVPNRMKNHRTSCPLPSVATFTAKLPSRHDAIKMEAHLLARMAGDRLHGEWVRVGERTGRDVLALLTEAARELRPVEFRES